MKAEYTLTRQEPCETDCKVVLADVKRDFENDDACAFRTFSNDRDSVGAAATCNVAATAFTCFALFLRFPEQLRSKVFFSIPQPWLPGPPTTRDRIQLILSYFLFRI